MSQKNFCDNCGAELTAANRPYQLENDGVGVLYKVLSVGHRGSVDAVSTVDVCKYCVIGAIAALDDRPCAGEPR